MHICMCALLFYLSTPTDHVSEETCDLLRKTKNTKHHVQNLVVLSYRVGFHQGPELRWLDTFGPGFRSHPMATVASTGDGDKSLL